MSNSRRKVLIFGIALTSFLPLGGPDYLLGLEPGTALKQAHQLLCGLQDRTHSWISEIRDGLLPRVAPAFYQTTSFKAFCWAMGSFLLWVAYRARLRIVTGRVRDLLVERLAERERIAGEFHDALLQDVQGLILLFYGIAAELPPDSPLSGKIDLAIGRAERLLEEGRDSVKDLGSATFSLADAFRSLERDFQGSSTHYAAAISGEQPDLQLLVCDEIFKLGREAVRNALQHAEAKTVEVHLVFQPYALDLSIRDDGVGIPEDVLRNGRAGHWGLLGMRERARNLRATLEIKSEVGKGTLVHLTLPASVAYRNIIPSVPVLLHMYWARLRSSLRKKADLE